MRKYIIYIGLSVWLFIPKGVWAQDMHYSQFNASPIALSPAATGLFDGNYRVSLMNRTQWGTVSTPYHSFSVSLETKWPIKLKFANDVLGIGILVDKDKAGDAQMSLTMLQLAIAYFKELNQHQDSYLSIGTLLGVGQRTLNMQELTFDNQFNGEIFDGRITSNEATISTSFVFQTIGAGVQYSYLPAFAHKFNAGVGWYHLNRPYQSFFEQEQVRLRTKTTIYGNSYVVLGTSVVSTQGVYFAHQGSYNQVVIGGTMRYQAYSPDKEKSFSLGVYNRFNDAAILVMGMNIWGAHFGISYDINYSSLKVATHSYGALEWSMSYSHKKKKTTKIRAVPCPVF